MCKPKPTRKTDILNDREFKRLVSTTHEDYLAQNYNCSQLNKLCSSEKDHLQIYYEYLEKRIERNQKRIRSKHTKKSPTVIIRNIPAPEEIPVEGAAPPVAEVSDAGRSLPVVEDVEIGIVRNPNDEQSPKGVRDIEQNLEDLNVSLAQVELSQVMPPKELLIEDVPLPAPQVHPMLEGIDEDLESLPLSDPQVRAQILNEFPSLRPGEHNGRFEEFEELPMSEERALLMPPPLDGGLKASTPISSIPTANIRRKVPVEKSRLETADLSAINDPTPLKPSNAQEIAELMEGHAVEQEIASNQQVEVVTEKETQESVQRVPSVESVHISEPMDVVPSTPQEEPIRRVPAPVDQPTTSDSSIGRPVSSPRRVTKTVKKVRVYGDSISLDTNELRRQFEIFDDLEDLRWLDNGRNVIKSLMVMQNHRAGTQMRSSNELHGPRDSLVAEIEQQQILRDKSTTFGDISSIREQATSKLYTILEGPQDEDRGQHLLQSKAAPVPIEEIPSLPEVPIVQSTGLDIQSIVPNATSIETPQLESISVTNGRIEQETVHGENMVNVETVRSHPVGSNPVDDNRPPEKSQRDGPFGSHDKALVSVSTTFIT
ncbi:uncharacterized protein LOC131686253 isoform X2 [Topomyia yanbarensis]|uniref:uncharacterized protein LOC131686253 isoform X2 n=1 Tax=Topomyia yanbarensis TaxID=2498891 RepID=UPI00273A8330|nr:uncharacterized protein LOC131686253 isoform X2 [Topomyia yanbarensis]